MRMSIDEFRAYEAKRKPEKRPKYGNKRVTVNGLTFDSMKEARRHADLVLQQESGQIVELERQKEYELVVNGQLICKYVADFFYRRYLYPGQKWDRVDVVEDVKSKPTREKRDYIIKRKLMIACHGIAIQEI